MALLSILLFWWSFNLGAQNGPKGFDDRGHCLKEFQTICGSKHKLGTKLFYQCTWDKIARFSPNCQAKLRARSKRLSLVQAHRRCRKKLNEQCHKYRGQSKYKKKYTICLRQKKSKAKLKCPRPNLNIGGS